MPRVENIGSNVDHWYDHEADGCGSSTFDVCFDCHFDLTNDPHAYDDELAPYNGDPSGDAGRGGDVEHPPYDDFDNDYECEVCGKQLIGFDD